RRKAPPDKRIFRQGDSPSSLSCITPHFIGQGKGTATSKARRHRRHCSRKKARLLESNRALRTAHGGRKILPSGALPGAPALPASRFRAASRPAPRDTLRRGLPSTQLPASGFAGTALSAASLASGFASGFASGLACAGSLPPCRLSPS